MNINTIETIDTATTTRHFVEVEGNERGDLTENALMLLAEMYPDNSEIVQHLDGHFEVIIVA